MRKFEVTFKHTKIWFKDHVVVVTVSNNESVIEKAIEKAKQDGMIFASDGYDDTPIKWRILQGGDDELQ